MVIAMRGYILQTSNVGSYWAQYKRDSPTLTTMVPTQLRTDVLDNLHSVHQGAQDSGVKTMKKLLVEKHRSWKITEHR